MIDFISNNLLDWNGCSVQLKIPVDIVQVVPRYCSIGRMVTINYYPRTQRNYTIQIAVKIASKSRTLEKTTIDIIYLKTVVGVEIENETNFCSISFRSAITGLFNHWVRLEMKQKRSEIVSLLFFIALYPTRCKLQELCPEYQQIALSHLLFYSLKRYCALMFAISLTFQ